MNKELVDFVTWKRITSVYRLNLINESEAEVDVLLGIKRSVVFR